MIANHQDRAIALLASQFCEKPVIEGLVRALVGAVQDVENVAGDLLVKRALDEAEGRQLDLLGELLGEPRLAREDDEYRQAIRFRIFINTSNGTPNEVIRIFTEITGATNVRYFELYPGKISFQATGANYPENFSDVMLNVIPSGVCLESVTDTAEGTVPFSFEGDPQEGGFFCSLGGVENFKVNNNGTPEDLILGNGEPLEVMNGEEKNINEGCGQFAGLTTNIIEGC